MVDKSAILYATQVMHSSQRGVLLLRNTARVQKFASELL